MSARGHERRTAAGLTAGPCPLLPKTERVLT